MAAPGRTHYDILGIARDADAHAVRSAWKLHVQAWHPDRFSGSQREGAEHQTQLINEAYSVLRDSSRRAAYDCGLAADEQVARPEPSRSRRPAVQYAQRPAAAPIGSPMAAATAPARAPETISEHASAIGSDAWRLVRRHPRVFAAVASTWLVIIGVSVAMSLASGPTLPASQPQSMPRSAIVADSQQLDQLEDLAERARQEAAVEDAEMQRLIAEDARRAAAEEAAARRAERAAAKAEAKAAAKASTRNEAGRRIMRVMPNAR